MSFLFKRLLACLNLAIPYSRYYGIMWVKAPSMIFLLFCSCVEKELELKIPAIEEDRLSVLATLINDTRFSVLVGRVIPLDNEPVDYRIDDALVILYEHNKPIDTLIFETSDQQANQPLRNGFYISRDTLTLVDDASYHLEVSAPGFVSIESSPVKYKKIFADDFSVNQLTTSIDPSTVEVERTYQLRLLAAAPSEVVEREFGFDAQLAVPSSELSRQQPYLLFDSRNIVGTNLPAGTYAGGYSSVIDTLFNYDVCFQLLHYNDEFLAFAKAFSAQGRENIGGVDVTPAELPSNIIGGFGYFSVLDGQCDCANQ